MSKSTEFSELVSDVREQILYLKELGIDILSVDLPQKDVPLPSARNEKLTIDSPETPFAKPQFSRPETTVRKPGSRLSALPSLSKRKIARNGDDDVPLRSVGKPENVENTETGGDIKPKDESMKQAATLYGDISPTLSETSDTIESIRAEIGDCTRCALHSLGRKQIVHTTGNFNADLMFVGEAPGADEDEQGFPFVGRAGQLLTKIIEGIGLKREDVCIGNINRCRPPGNRKPEPEETVACRPFILREIAVVKPRVIVVLGATAAQNLLQVKTPITKLRGHFHDYFGVKVMPTFHPAYLLRDPHKKREVWEDMKMVRDYLNSL